MSRCRAVLLCCGVLLTLALTSCAAPGESSAPAAAKAGIVDYRCQADSDCAVKNIGNCCGYYPACVNKDSATWPEQVRADCQREGKMAVCGFREITACSCRQGRCEASGSPLGNSNNNNDGASKNRRERPECKAHGAQEPQCTYGYMRIPSTAQRSNRGVQQVFRGAQEVQ